jgi:hypothetical protein
MFSAVARRFGKRELDVAREARVRRLYDRDCGYERYHAWCRKHFRREVSDAATPLLAEGVERLRVTSEAVAKELREELQRWFRNGPFRKNAERVSEYRIDDPDFVHRMLASVLTRDVDARATQFFRSEYFVHWFVASRAMPRPDENFNSFLWHCDRGPRAHLKLLVYLNGVDEHGGRTDFLDLAGTRDLARSGYLFGRVSDRRAELGPLAAQVGAECRPRSWDLAAGEALLFQPSNVLHRGRMPSRAARTMLAICLLPSPVSWREALARGVMSDLARDPKWHRDAMDVARALGSPSA